MSAGSARWGGRTPVPRGGGVFPVTGAEGSPSAAPDLAVRFQLGRCRSVKEFEKLNRIGEGTYGIVCKGSHVVSGGGKRGPQPSYHISTRGAGGHWG